MVKIIANSDVFMRTRVAKGMSQRDLARQVGLSFSYICLIEHSHRSVSPATAKRLCEILERNIDELFEIY